MRIVGSSHIRDSGLWHYTYVVKIHFDCSQVNNLNDKEGKQVFNGYNAKFLEKLKGGLLVDEEIYEP